MPSSLSSSATYFANRLADYLRSLLVRVPCKVEVAAGDETGLAAALALELRMLRGESAEIGVCHNQESGTTPSEARRHAVPAGGPRPKLVPKYLCATSFMQLSYGTI